MSVWCFLFKSKIYLCHTQNWRIIAQTSMTVFFSTRKIWLWTHIMFIYIILKWSVIVLTFLEIETQFPQLSVFGNTEWSYNFIAYQESLPQRITNKCEPKAENVTFIFKAYCFEIIFLRGCIKALQLHRHLEPKQIV